MVFKLLTNGHIWEYLVIFQVFPQSNDFSMYIAFGRNVLYVMIRWVTWNSASKSSWIVTFFSPFSACHHVLYWSILGLPKIDQMKIYQYIVKLNKKIL